MFCDISVIFFTFKSIFITFLCDIVIIVKNKTLNSIQKEIQHTHLLLIIAITFLFTFGGIFINLNAYEKSLNQDLQNMASLVSQLYSRVKKEKPENIVTYFESIEKDLSNVDVISIINLENKRIYHSNHSLIGTHYDGTLPDFQNHKGNFYTENDKGPSGPQRRAYSAIYDENGIYEGFIMTITLKTTIHLVMLKSIFLFLTITLIAIIIELSLSKKISRNITLLIDDLSGTKYLVDSMRANNHDFTNKLHVILGLIQIGEYDKAISYIENISIIQRETISQIMHAINNSSFAALLIGKIARASECNVKFILKEGSVYKDSDYKIPSDALVTICGNLIDNAIDAMNMTEEGCDAKVLTFGVFTRPGAVLITVDDNGCGISKENMPHLFDKGFSTKGRNRGVGLHHIKQLVESLGGEISCESQVGIGTAFIVTWKK